VGWGGGGRDNEKEANSRVREYSYTTPFSPAFYTRIPVLCGQWPQRLKFEHFSVLLGPIQAPIILHYKVGYWPFGTHYILVGIQYGNQFRLLQVNARRIGRRTVACVNCVASFNVRAINWFKCSCDWRSDLPFRRFIADCRSRGISKRVHAFCYAAEQLCSSERDEKHSILTKGHKVFINLRSLYYRAREGSEQRWVTEMVLGMGLMSLPLRESVVSKPQHWDGHGLRTGQSAVEEQRLAPLWQVLFYQTACAVWE
jgi:hypothetical protein